MSEGSGARAVTTEDRAEGSGAAVIVAPEAAPATVPPDDLPAPAEAPAPAADEAGAPEPVGDDRGRWRRRRDGLAVQLQELQTWLLLAPVIVIGAAGWNHRWVTDDGFINFRVVEMTIQGHPFSINAHERVESGTSTLWVAVLTVLRGTLGWFIELPWLAVLSGLGLTVLGVGAAVAASNALVRHLEGDPVDEAATGRLLVLPAGALMLAVLPPAWDFATSGLETGLTFGWIGGSQWFLTRRFIARDRGDEVMSSALRWAPVVLGLGPLIRPDLLVFTLAYLVVLVVPMAGWRARLRAVGLAAAVPMAFEVFRMAYFASLVPNTALTKEAGQANVAKGMAYLDNLTSPYFLWVPLVVVAVWGVSWLVTTLDAPGPRRGLVLLTAVPVAGAVLHAGFIVRVGGDFMHGRLLLPALAGVLLPFAALPVSRERFGAGVSLAATVLVAWAVLCAGELRLPPNSMSGRWADIEDERAGYMGNTGKRHPVSLEDYASIAAPAEKANQLAARGEDVLILTTGDTVPLPEGSGVVLEVDRLGAVSYAADADVTVHDLYALADGLASRLTAVPTARVGHQKGGTTREWELGRRGIADDEVSALNERSITARTPAGAEPVDAPVPDPAMVGAARSATQCPQVQELVAATTEPLGPGRLLANLLAAPRLTELRIPRDPRDVVDCRFDR